MCNVGSANVIFFLERGEKTSYWDNQNIFIIHKIIFIKSGLRSILNSFLTARITNLFSIFVVKPSPLHYHFLLFMDMQQMAEDFIMRNMVNIYSCACHVTLGGWKKKDLY